MSFSGSFISFDCHHLFEDLLNLNEKSQLSDLTRHPKEQKVHFKFPFFDRGNENEFKLLKEKIQFWIESVDQLLEEFRYKPADLAVFKKTVEDIWENRKIDLLKKQSECIRC